MLEIVHILIKFIVLSTLIHSQRLLYSYFHRELIGNQQGTKVIRLEKTVTSGKQQYIKNRRRLLSNNKYTVNIYFLSNLLDIELCMYVASIYISCFKRCK